MQIVAWRVCGKLFALYPIRVLLSMYIYIRTPVIFVLAIKVVNTESVLPQKKTSACISVCFKKHLIICLCSGPCVSYLLRRRALYNDMSRSQLVSYLCTLLLVLKIFIPPFAKIVRVFLLFFSMAGILAVLDTCLVVGGVVKANALNSALPPRSHFFFL